MVNAVCLQELRRLILIKQGIITIVPSDCLIISIAIQRETKKNISETTLKRFFGFAEHKHDFSKFTINTLKEFAGVVEPEKLFKRSHVDKLG